MPLTRFIAFVSLVFYPRFLHAFSNRGYQHGEVTTVRLNLKKESVDSAFIEDAGSAVSGVTLKIAFDSQWGVADMSSEKSERFTCGESLDMVHRLRRCSDAVLVGRTTVERDDCTLTVRRVPPSDKKQPVRVIIDPARNLKVENFKIAKDGLRTLIFYIRPSFEQMTSKEFPNITFIGIPAKSGKNISTRDICEVLKKQHNIHHIMVEGGPATARCFLEEGMVDRAILVHAPICFKEPLPSNLSPSNFREAGLEFLGGGTFGVDSVDYWSRAEIPWPANPPSSWP